MLGHYRTVLKTEFIKRSSRNPNYSLRSFARSLGVDPSALSKALNSKKPLSRPMAKKVLQNLELNPRETKQFMASVEAEFQNKWLEEEKKDDFMEISGDQFAIISDWYHYALLEHTHSKDFDPSPKTMAQKLGIGEMQAKLAVGRLEKLGLLKVDPDTGQLKKADANLTIHDKNVTSAAHKKLQRDVLEKGIQSLDRDPLELRNMVSTTFAIDVNKIPEAKKLTQQFMRALSKLLECGENRKVYHLGVCLYPVEKSLEEKT